MRLIFAVAFLPLLVLAPQPQADDHGLPTGAHVRFWSHDVASQGWLQGTVIRFLPAGGGECIGIHSESLAGFNSIQRIDSLEVALTSPPAMPPTATTKWKRIVVAPLHALSKGCPAQPLHK